VPLWQPGVVRAGAQGARSLAYRAIRASLVEVRAVLYQDPTQVTLTEDECVI
jgi:hypothetical protein